MPGDVILRIQNAFVTQTGEVCPGLRAISVTCCQEGFRIMVRFSGGDPFFAKNAFSAALRFQRFAIVVVTGGHTSAHHIVCGLNIPDAFLPAVTHACRVTKRQGHTKLILLLRVLKNDHILLKAAIHRKAPVNTDFSQQTLNELKIGFPPPGN